MTKGGGTEQHSAEGILPNVIYWDGEMQQWIMEWGQPLKVLETQGNRFFLVFPDKNATFLTHILIWLMLEFTSSEL